MKSNRKFSEILKKAIPTSNGEYTGMLYELNDVRIKYSKDITFPTPIIKVGNSIVSTPQNLTVISGKEKSGKSSVLMHIISKCLNKNDRDVTDDFTIPDSEKHKGVVYIDTEQSTNLCQYRIVNILDSLSINDMPPNLHVYNFRQYDIQDRLLYLAKILHISQNDNDGNLVCIIDGIGDFVYNKNDEVESNELVYILDQFSQFFDVSFILVLHTGKSSDNTLGHLGSQLDRKAESILLVRQKNDEILVDAKELRNCSKFDYSTPIYKIASNGLLDFQGITNNNTSQSFSKNLPKLAGDLVSFFNNKEQVSYTQLSQKIQSIQNVKERTAKERIKELKEAGLISKDETTNNYFFE